jgi:hypothetical protein
MRGCLGGPLQSADGCLRPAALEAGNVALIGLEPLCELLLRQAGARARAEDGAAIG